MKKNNPQKLKPWIPVSVFGFCLICLLAWGRSNSQFGIRPSSSYSKKTNAKLTKASSKSTTASDVYLMPPPACSGSPNIIAGYAWEDINNDGIKDAGETSGVSGITVQIFDEDGSQVGTDATTDADGNWSIDVSSAATTCNNLRVEYSNIPSWAQLTYEGVDNGTTVQLVPPGSCANLGLINPADYCQNNPLFITPCYINGDNTGAQDALVGIPYNGGAIQHLATAAQIGSTWGVAYNRDQERAYVGATLRRHVGLTGNGLDVLFEVNPFSGSANASVWAQLNDDYGINTGSVPSNASRGLGGVNSPSTDPEGFFGIGHLGIGDIDISETNDKVWLTNLYTKQLHGIAINPDGSAGTIESYDIPMPARYCLNLNTIYLNSGSTIITSHGLGPTDVAWEGDAYAVNGSIANIGGQPAPYSNTRFGTNFRYIVPVPAGTYRVTTYHYNTAGVNMDVIIDETTNSVSIPNAMQTNITHSDQTVTDGLLEIQFVRTGGANTNAFVNGIEIEAVSGDGFNEAAPFAIKYFQGDVYVGVACNAEYSQEKDSLHAYIYKFDDDNNTFSEYFDFPLSDRREPVFDQCVSERLRYFSPWLNVWRNHCNFGLNNGSTAFNDASPIFADIEFDNDLSLILGIVDRSGMQTGNGQWTPAGGGNISAISGGDIMRACYINGQHVFQSDIADNSGCSYQVSNPSNGTFPYEYYTGEHRSGGSEAETAWGGLAFKKGDSKVAVTAMDPTNIINSGGIILLDNISGVKTNGHLLYNSGGGSSSGPTFAKSQGLGDLELMCESLPIQIGNYIWIDENNDGVQDACELPVPGISVSLYDKTSGDLVAVTTTAANGEYYFTNSSDPDENWFNSYTQLTTNTQYAIVFGYDGNTSTGQFDANSGRFDIGGSFYELTTANSGTGNTPDQNDSDASLMTQGSLVNYPIIMYTTTNETDHTLDAGLVLVQSFDLALTKVINTIATPGPYVPGDNVTFTIEVYNQGTIDATDIEITDYVPTEMIFNIGDNTDFSGSLTAPIATIANLPSGMSTTVEITLQIDPNTFAASTVNYAEITSFDDDNNTATPAPIDEDSTPGDNQGDDEKPTDNDVDDEAPGTPGTTDNPNDADDYDPAMVMIDQPPCLVEIVNIQVNCVSVTEYELSFDVNWDYANATTDVIEVSVDGVLQPMITPAGITGTQSFGPITLTGPVYDIPLMASFTTNLSCTTNVLIDLVPDAICVPPCTNTLGGTTFQDLDNDGEEDISDMIQSNVLVEIYECDNDVPVAVTYSNINGEWSVDDANITYPVRVEFSTPLHPLLAPSFQGIDNGTNTQFVNAANCEVDYSIIEGGCCIQIGNYVWEDTNGDGVQDACEPSFPNFTVKLYTKPVTGNAELVATTTTDVNGEYYFTNSNAPNETWETGFTELISGESYFVVFMGDAYDALTGKITVNSMEYEPTITDTGEGNNPDFNDSDVSIMNVPGIGDMPVVMLAVDETDHTIDAGIKLSRTDYGDLPDSYATLATSNGARHSLKSGLYLGSCVDIEATGAPDFEAGTDGSGGDDQTTGLLTEGTCAGNDDEDGIFLLTPLIPGSTACIEVTATSVNGTAVLNAWIDFNGDGDFVGDANENLVFTSIDGAPIGATTDAPVANGTGTYVYCFDVPAGATFPNQETHMRFRLSMNGGLPYNGPSDSGEVEDYYQPLAKIGNIVWEDVNGNAIQDAGEPGFAGVDVTITSTDLQGNPVSVTLTTGADGMYMFPGLLPGEEYCIHFDISNAPNAGELIFTPQDVPFNMDEVNDSDADPQTGNAGCYMLNPLEYNPNVDAGVYSDKDGDFIPDMMDPDMNNLDPQGYIYCEDSGEIIPGGLVDVVAGPGLVNMIQDGSTGVYQFFVSQPGTYTIAFTPPAGYVISTTCLDQGLLDPDPMDPSPFIVGSDDADNDGFLDDSSCGANTFYMQFTLEVGEFILQNNIPLSCAEIGDTVWEDNDTDGIQDPGEPGVPDIAVLLFECAGGVKGNQIGTTTTDANGNYEFTGLPGNVEYCVQFDLAGSTNPNAGLYFFTTQDQTLGGGDDTNDSDANPIDGCTTSELLLPGEEYPDFDAGVYLVDYGDLPENNGYPTTLASMGAAHVIPSSFPLLKLGATVDAETDGQPSADALGDGVDEDGVTLPMFMTGIPEDIDMSVMNMTGSEAKLVMYVDWNNDGDFDDVNEMYSVMVPDGATVVTLDDVTPPLTANLAVPIGVRFRISTDQAVVMSPTGLAPDGEVEDYITPSMGFDYGDLNDVALGTTGDPGQPLTPADYQTSLADNGPGHKIITDINDNPILKIGSAVDDEADGQPSADAGITGGDDNAIAPLTSDPDDEDGLDENNLPLFIITQTTTLDIPVMNMTGADATIAVFVDFNKDGAFDPGTERFEAPVPDMATTVSVNIPVPLSSVIGQDVGLRIRLANNPAEVATSVGIAQSGEVEDYMVQIVGFDYGDLPDTYGTTDPDGPKHIVSEDLLLGSCVDVELDGQEAAMAGLMTGGDDNGTGLVTFGSCATAGDDEDGIVFSSPLIPGHPTCVEVTSVNNTGADAVLQMWVDYNGDGAFGAGEEVTFTSANTNTIPNGGVASEPYCFDVPADATFFGGAAFVRFRLSPNGGTVPDGQDINAVQFGEIEDYKVPLYKVGSYVWDDLNGDGLQDDFSSPCMDDVEMQLVWGGPDDNLATTGDNQIYLVTSDEVNSIHGQFVFCGLIPGSYELSIADIPSGLAPTVIGAGVDPNYDSNDPHDPCGMVPPIYTGKVPISRIGLQQTYVFYKNGVETFVIRPGFTGNVDNFGMLIPFPTPPALRKVPDDVFPHLDAAVDPPEIVIDCMPLPMQNAAAPAGQGGGGGFAFGARRDTVKVLKQEAVGMYEVAVLAAGSARALKKWMDEHGYQYPDGMDKVCEDYISEDWCFVAVKTKVGTKAGADPKPGQRKVNNQLPGGSAFDGHVQGMGFRFKTDELVVPMRLSAFNEGDLRNVVYLLTDEPKKIRAIPEEYVMRQIQGKTLLANLTEPLPVRVLNGTFKDIPEWERKTLKQRRDPYPHNGIAKELFASDLIAVESGEMSLKHEEDEKELLRVGEHFGLRGPEIDGENATALKESRDRAVSKGLDLIKEMTLTVIDGDFPREVIAKQNLQFATYKMPSQRNVPQKYDSKLHGPAPKRSGVLKIGAIDWNEIDRQAVASNIDVNSSTYVSGGQMQFYLIAGVGTLVCALGGCIFYWRVSNPKQNIG